jgi:hypothetical protein
MIFDLNDHHLLCCCLPFLCDAKQEPANGIGTGVTEGYDTNSTGTVSSDVAIIPFI